MMAGYLPSILMMVLAAPWGGAFCQTSTYFLTAAGSGCLRPSAITPAPGTILTGTSVDITITFASANGRFMPTLPPGRCPVVRCLTGTCAVEVANAQVTWAAYVIADGDAATKYWPSSSSLTGTSLTLSFTGLPTALSTTLDLMLPDDFGLIIAVLPPYWMVASMEPMSFRYCGLGATSCTSHSSPATLAALPNWCPLATRTGLAAFATVTADALPSAVVSARLSACSSASPTLPSTVALASCTGSRVDLEVLSHRSSGQETLLVTSVTGTDGFTYELTSALVVVVTSNPAAETLLTVPLAFERAVSTSMELTQVNNDATPGSVALRGEHLNMTRRHASTAEVEALFAGAAAGSLTLTVASSNLIWTLADSGWLAPASFADFRALTSAAGIESAVKAAFPGAYNTYAARFTSVSSGAVTEVSYTPISVPAASYPYYALWNWYIRAVSPDGLGGGFTCPKGSARNALCPHCAEVLHALSSDHGFLSNREVAANDGTFKDAFTYLSYKRSPTSPPTLATNSLEVTVQFSALSGSAALPTGSPVTSGAPGSPAGPLHFRAAPAGSFAAQEAVAGSRLLVPVHVTALQPPTGWSNAGTATSPATDPRTWLLIPEAAFGSACDQIGVTAESFAAQPDRCNVPHGTCLDKQLSYYQNRPLQYSPAALLHGYADSLAGSVNPALTFGSVSRPRTRLSRDRLIDSVAASTGPPSLQLQYANTGRTPIHISVDAEAISVKSPAPVLASPQAAVASSDDLPSNGVDERVVTFSVMASNAGLATASYDGAVTCTPSPTSHSAASGQVGGTLSGAPLAPAGPAAGLSAAVRVRVGTGMGTTRCTATLALSAPAPSFFPASAASAAAAFVAVHLAGPSPSGPSATEPVLAAAMCTSAVATGGGFVTIAAEGASALDQLKLVASPSPTTDCAGSSPAAPGVSATYSGGVAGVSSTFAILVAAGTLETPCAICYLRGAALPSGVTDPANPAAGAVPAFVRVPSTGPDPWVLTVRPALAISAYVVQTTPGTPAVSLPGPSVTLTWSFTAGNALAAGTVLGLDAPSGMQFPAAAVVTVSQAGAAPVAAASALGSGGSASLLHVTLPVAVSSGSPVAVAVARVSPPALPGTTGPFLLSVKSSSLLVIEGPVSAPGITFYPQCVLSAPVATGAASIAARSAEQVAPAAAAGAVVVLERGSSPAAASFTLALPSPPAGEVTYAVVSSNPGLATAVPSLLVFSSLTFSQPQTVVLRATAPASSPLGAPLPGEAVTLSVSAVVTPLTAADPLFAGLVCPATALPTIHVVDPRVALGVTGAPAVLVEGTNATLTVNVVPPAPPGCTLAIAEPVSTSSNLTSASVVRSELPNARVVIAHLEHPSTNVDSPLTVSLAVTATGLCGASSYWAVLATATVVGGVVLRDNDWVSAASISWPAAAPPPRVIELSEAVPGGLYPASAALSFSLLPPPSPPSGMLLVRLSTNDTSETRLSRSEYLLSPGEWGRPQDFSVAGVKDSVVDGTQASAIRVEVHAADSRGVALGLLASYDLLALTHDSDTAEISAVADGATTGEDGSSSLIVVSLSTAPKGDVTVPAASLSPGEATVSPLSLTFTVANWATPQTLTATGVADAVVDQLQPFVVALGPTVSASDLGYAGRTRNLTLFNRDAASSGLQYHLSGRFTSEGRVAASLVIAGSIQLTAAVGLNVRSNNPAEGVASPGRVSLTPKNWKQAQVIVIQGVDDDIQDGDTSYDVSVAPDPASLDIAISAGFLPNISFTLLNVDDEVLELTARAVLANGTAAGAAAAACRTREAAPVLVTPNQGGGGRGGGSFPFLVSLRSKPAAGGQVVNISAEAVAGAAPGPEEARVTPSLITFTPANWSTPVMVVAQGQRTPGNNAENRALGRGGAPYRIAASFVGKPSLAPAVLWNCTNEDVAWPQVAAIAPSLFQSPPSASARRRRGGGQRQHGLELATGPTVTITGSDLADVVRVEVGGAEASVVSSSPGVLVLGQELTFAAGAGLIANTSLGFYADISIFSRDGGSAHLSQAVYVARSCATAGVRQIAGQPLGRCERCSPPGVAQCPGGDRTWPSAGHWNLNEQTTAIGACRPAEACAGGRGSPCTPGYTHRMCARCVDGFYRGPDARCRPCGSSRNSALVRLARIGAITIWLSVLTGAALAKSVRPSLLPTLVAVSWAAQGLLAAQRAAPSSAELTEWSSLISVLGLDAEFTLPGCVVADGHARLLFLRLGVHAGALSVGALLLASVGAVRSKRTRVIAGPERAGEVLAAHRAAAMSLAAAVAALAYFPLTSSFIAGLWCVPLGRESLLGADAAVTCFVGAHVPVAIVCLAGILVVTVASPIAATILAVRRARATGGQGLAFGGHARGTVVLPAAAALALCPMAAVGTLPFHRTAAAVTVAAAGLVLASAAALKPLQGRALNASVGFSGLAATAFGCISLAVPGGRSPGVGVRHAAAVLLAVAVSALAAAVVHFIVTWRGTVAAVTAAAAVESDGEPDRDLSNLAASARSRMSRWSDGASLVSRASSPPPDKPAMGVASLPPHSQAPQALPQTAGVSAGNTNPIALPGMPSAGDPDELWKIDYESAYDEEEDDCLPSVDNSRFVIEDAMDLSIAQAFPDIAVMWHEPMNVGKSPWDVTVARAKVHFFRCPNNHVFTIDFAKVKAHLAGRKRSLATTTVGPWRGGIPELTDCNHCSR